MDNGKNLPTNTIQLNTKEKKGVYSWVNKDGTNPVLTFKLSTNNVVQIKNPTDSKHDLATSNQSLDLVEFGGKGKYRPPEFTWINTVAPTALRFLTTDKLGEQYKNDILVGDVKDGNIYHFKLNTDRNGFLLNGTLADKVSSGEDTTEQLEFAHGFGIITDLEIGPDGNLYVLVFDSEDGRIYKIVPTL